MGLSTETCVPCRKGGEGISAVNALKMLQDLPEWALVDDGMAIRRRYTCSNFATACAFVQQVAALAEAQNHHPDIAFGWGYAEIRFTTHAIGGLHRNDFIMAAKVDNIAESR